MFVTAVCFLFLLKLKWPKNKNKYYIIIIIIIKNDIHVSWFLQNEIKKLLVTQAYLRV